MTDSQSVITPSISSASLVLPQPPPASIPPQELIYKHRRYRRIEHPPSKRRGLEQSQIWQHGTDYEYVDDTSIHGWRCLYCFKDHLAVMKPGIEVTTNARRHLRIVHSMNLDNARVRKRVREEDEEDEMPVAKAPQIKGLTTIVNVDEFRYRLTRWMVNRHVAFSEVENSNF